MAIWQFSINFIPRENLIKRFGKIPKTVDEEILWKENLEESVKLPENYEDFLSCLGDKETLKWGGKKFNWGDYDNGTHLTIIFDTDNASIFCRFNVGEWDEDFAKTVLEFAKICDCVLQTNNQNIIEPELNLLIEQIKASNSYRFCKNPIEYLQSGEVKEINEVWKKKMADNDFDFNL